MSDLWIYFRRPSSLIRYRHGGAAAFDPALRVPLAADAVLTGTGTVLQPLPREEEKILQFPGPKPGARKNRAGKTRGSARAKPMGPKKRD